MSCRRTWSFGRGQCCSRRCSIIGDTRGPPRFRSWGQGADAEAAATLEAIGKTLGVADVSRVIAEAPIKDAVRANTNEAIALGVFGVPTFAYAGELFWGDDATPLFAAFLADGDMFKREPYLRIERVTASAERTAKTSE
jgi:hypothetical protein